jgi:anti-anti-sigma factor
MDIAEEKDGEAVVLTPDGDLNTPQECGVLERKLAQSIESGARALVIDCRKTPRVSAAAIRLLLLMQRRLGQLHGCLVLCGLGDIVRRVFAISGFDRDFTIVVAREDAVARALAGAAERRRAVPAGDARAAAKADAVMPAAGPAPTPAPPPSPLAQLAAQLAEALAAGEKVEPPPPLPPDALERWSAQLLLALAARRA